MTAEQQEREATGLQARREDHDTRLLGGFAIIQVEELLVHLTEHGIAHYSDEDELRIYVAAVKDLCHTIQPYDHSLRDGHLVAAGHPAGLHPSIVEATLQARPGDVA